MGFKNSFVPGEGHVTGCCEKKKKKSGLMKFREIVD
jgi:hypothetical protein